MCYKLLIYDCGHTKKQYEPNTPIYRLKQEKKEIVLPGVRKIGKKKTPKKKNIEMEIVNEKVPIYNKSNQLQQQEKHQDNRQDQDRDQDMKDDENNSSEDEKALCQCWGRTGEQIVLESCGKEKCKCVNEKEVERVKAAELLEIEREIQVNLENQAQDEDLTKDMNQDIQCDTEVFESVACLRTEAQEVSEDGIKKAPVMHKESPCVQS